MKKYILGVMLAITLAGCASIGKDFDESQLANIHKGESTEQSVISYFGEPTTQTVDGNGNKMLMWNYSHATAFGKAKGKALMVQISNGVVQNYTISTTTM